MESELHRSMKLMVRCELESQRYRVVEEPPYPPTRRISWTAYRPDLLGLRSEPGVEEVAIVECETHPSMTRFAAKNHTSLWFEPEIFREGSIRRILAVPRGRLHAVDLRLRRHWEIWVLGPTAPLERISATG
ncbi:MAG: hypothetical protein ABSF83_09305 [Nitrososphaerales archaeon]|jgi:hypothetical protein